MGRLLIILILVALFGCRVPPNREDLKLFDEKKIQFGYGDLYLRARSQANLALEAFYADNWGELDDAAKALEQTARFLPKSVGNPVVARPAEQLEADASRLGEAARAKDVRVANEVLQRIQFNIRTLRPKQEEPPTKD